MSAVIVRLLLSTPLVGALLATGLFWAAATREKGSAQHRACGRWFARVVYIAAGVIGVVALVAVAAPAMFSSAVPAVSEARHAAFFVLYLLVLIVTPVHHGLAVVAAAGAPLRVRSRAHAVLNISALLSTVFIFPAAVVWHSWLSLLLAPAGFVIALRNMTYAGRSQATPTEWQREHLTSAITAGMALHVALGLLLLVRASGRGDGWWGLLCCAGPAVAGVATIAGLRHRWRAQMPR